MRKITFNGITNLDIGFTVESFDPGCPTPRTNEVSVPYRDSTIDMDDLMGVRVLDDRNITIKLWKKCADMGEVETAKHELLEWFMLTVGKVTLQDSLESYAYNAKCSSVDTSESNFRVCRATVILKADPYRVNSGGEKSI